jgi:DNA (cytosine-5)-methyltransferase 1
VLGDLSKIGYDAEWQIISAADVGAKHLRKRIWIIAYPNSESESDVSVNDGWEVSRAVADTQNTHGWGANATEHTRRRNTKIRGQSKSGGRIQYWSTEPDVGRVAHGVPARVDRLKCLGNAVVPQCAYLLGTLIKSLQ